MYLNQARITLDSSLLDRAGQALHKSLELRGPDNYDRTSRSGRSAVRGLGRRAASGPGRRRTRRSVPRPVRRRPRHRRRRPASRRNTAPDFAAFSPGIWDHTARTNDLPVAVRYTTDGGFLTTDKAGHSQRYDRLVYTIGQDASYPGGAADLLAKFALRPLTGPGAELNGLTDSAGTLRVLGAASVARAVVDATTQPDVAAEIDKKIRAQAEALPPDARGIQPSIRYHAGRIAEDRKSVV